jgi:hypothetical protein
MISCVQASYLLCFLNFSKMKTSDQAQGIRSEENIYVSSIMGGISSLSPSAAGGLKAGPFNSCLRRKTQNSGQMPFMTRDPPTLSEKPHETFFSLFPASVITVPMQILSAPTDAVPFLDENIF